MEYLTDINCDILLLSETWPASIRNDVTALVLTYGYNFFHIVRNTLKKEEEELVSSTKILLDWTVENIRHLNAVVCTHAVTAKL